MVSRLETRQGRIRAYEILQLQQKCSKFQWHIGLNSRSRIFLDFEFSKKPNGDVTLNSVTDAAFVLKEISKSKQVLVFKSSNKPGYHLVTAEKLTSHEKWKSVYNYFLGLKEDTPFLKGFDRIHAEISLRYGKSTLRISGTKKNKCRPMLVAVIN